jgi:molybdopterin-binding protein
MNRFRTTSPSGRHRLEELNCYRKPRGASIPTSETFLKPREAAAELGLSYPTIKQWILSGKLTTMKTPGGHHLIARSTLAPLMKSAPAKEETRERFKKVSGRNQLIGKIIEVKIDGLLAKVVLSIGEQRITSIITADAAREMQLRKGQTAAALMKATEVMITRV